MRFFRRQKSKFVAKRFLLWKRPTLEWLECRIVPSGAPWNVGVVRDFQDGGPNKLLTYLLDTDRDTDDEIRFLYGHGSQTPGGDGNADIAIVGDWSDRGAD